MSPSRRPLLSPSMRPRHPADAASRRSLVACQRTRLGRFRRARRTIRTIARLAGVTVVLAGLGVTLVVGANWVRTTTILAVRTMEIHGARRLNETVVRAAADVRLGTNLLALDVLAVEDRIASLPGVRHVRVVRHLPDRVTVFVEEREPYALVNAEGLFWIDAEGFVVASEPRPGAPILPILSGLPHPPAGPDQESPERLRSGLALLRTLERAGGRVAARISEIDLAPADGPVLYLTDGIEVRVGGDAWPDRLARLDGVLGDLDRRRERVSAVDLRFRDLVVLTPLPAGVVDGRPTPAATRLRPAASGGAISTSSLERR